MGVRVYDLLAFGSATSWTPWDTLRAWRSLKTRTEVRPEVLANLRLNLQSLTSLPSSPGSPWDMKQQIREPHTLKSTEFTETHWLSRGSLRPYRTWQTCNLLHHQAILQLNELCCRTKRSWRPLWPWDPWFPLVACVTIA